jgi:hypothetical protein
MRPMPVDARQWARWGLDHSWRLWVMDIFGDFGFVGGEDKSASSYQDNQICLNWYVELSPSKSAKVPVALLGCPGLIQIAAYPSVATPPSLWNWSDAAMTFDNPGYLFDGTSPSLPAPPPVLLENAWPLPSAVTNLPVRGSWPLRGSNQSLVVIANGCYLVTIASQGSSTIPAGIIVTKVGTLQTNVGPVAIRDNGLGGYAVVVDGPFGYLYNIAAQTFAKITDPNFLGADTVAFIDGWWIFNQPGTQTFYTNALPYAITFDASLFANKDAASDVLMGVMESKEELWLIGALTTEIWYNAGGAYFAFQRLVGTMLRVGCKAVHSIARFSSDNQDGLIWFGRSDRGENIVVRTRGFQAEVVTTPAVSDAIAKYQVTSDAIGYTYQEDTHEFYVLTFPTADRTWVFDSSVPLEMAWHQRLSYDPYSATFHRHRSNCYMNFAGNRIVGDYQNGALYQMTRSAYTDAGWPILAKRRAPYIWDKGARGRVFMGSLQLEFAPGQGTASGLGQNPQANLRISRDGTTFGQQWPAAMGTIGQYKARTLWRRLSFGRTNLVEVEVIAPVNRDLMGATLKAFAEQGVS